MRWSRGQRSRNIEDRRGRKSRVPGGAKGIGGAAGIIILLIGLAFGKDLGGFIGGGGGDGASSQGLQPGGGGNTATPSERGQPPERGNAPEDRDAELVDFVSFVLDDIQGTWQEIFRKQGKQYRETTLVLYTEGTPSGCGYGSSAIGPFYCPADFKVYLDLSFFKVMKKRLGAPGDFAQAYVIAHEIGHHIQNITGIDKEVRRRGGRDKRQKNQLSVRQELQADCYSGIWANATNKRDILERGDIEEGLKAAAAIGDDTLQRNAGRKVSPESFTHGSSAQRVRWFRRGFETGSMKSCDTFAARKL